MESLEIGVILLDASLYIRDLNDPACRYLHAGRDTLLETPISMSIVSPHTEHLLKLCRNTLHSHKKNTCRIPAEAPAPSRTCFIVTITFAHPGVCLCLQPLARGSASACPHQSLDTSSLTSSCVLQRHRTRLMETERLAGTGYFEYDFRSDAFSCSEGFRTILGIGPDAPMDLETLTERLSAEDRKRFLHRFSRLTSGDLVPETVTYHIIRPDGQHRHIQVRGTVCSNDPQGNPQHVLGVAYDCTDGVFAAQALRESEEKYRTLVEASPVGIVVHCDGTVMYANAAAVRGIGARSTEDLIGKPALGFLEAGTRDLAKQRMQRIYNGELVIGPQELSYVRLDGTTLHVEITTVGIIYKGKKAALALLKDITAQKAAEHQLLASRDKLRSLAIAMVSAREDERRKVATYLHDSVCQDLALWRITLWDLTRKDSRDAVHTGIEAIRSGMESTISYMGSFVRQLCPPAPSELSFRSALEWLGENVCEKRAQIRLIVEGADKDIDASREDLQALLAIIRELLVNAVKHAHCKKVVVSFLRTDSTIHISVTDDGEGFDPSSRATGSNGGFGLFSIRERLEAIGGAFTLQSSRGAGTHISFTFPLAHK